MLISQKYNFVVLSTPKCASRSIEAMLREYADLSFLGPAHFRHTNFRVYERYVRAYIEELAKGCQLETICLVREPISRLYSYYRFRSRRQLRDPNNPKHARSTHDISFSEFLDAVMQSNPPPFASIRYQAEFVSSTDSQIGVDRLFAYEKIDDFVDYMSDKVGRPLTLGFKNVSPKLQHRSNIAELVGAASRKLRGTVKLDRVLAVQKPEVELPDDLVARLRNHMPAEFDLYDRVINSA